MYQTKEPAEAGNCSGTREERVKRHQILQFSVRACELTSEILQAPSLPSREWGWLSLPEMLSIYGSQLALLYKWNMAEHSPCTKLKLNSTGKQDPLPPALTPTHRKAHYIRLVPVKVAIPGAGYN